MGKSSEEEEKDKQKKKNQKLSDVSVTEDSDSSSSSDSLSSDSLSISSSSSNKNKAKKNDLKKKRSSSSQNSADEDLKHTSRKSKKIKKRSKSKDQKKKKDKEKRKDKHKKKKDKDKDKKNKKKKHKKHKKKKEEKESNQCKYGFLTINDMHKKREEFVCWLREIKKVNVEGITPVEEKKLFEDFSEDFNTCSFPSKKYYDLMKWRIKQQKKINEGKKIGFQGEEITTFKDEDEIKIKRRQAKDQHLLNKAGNVLFVLKNEDNDLLKDYKKKEEALNLMKNYYKIGENEKALEISKKYDQKLINEKKKI